MPMRITEPLGWLGAASQSTLTAGQALKRGDQLISPNGRFKLILQTDSNLVLYGPGQALRAWGQTGNDSAAMQTDGNFVLYAGSSPTWASDTSGNGGARLVMQDDGNLVVYTPDNRALWSSETAGGVPYQPSGNFFSKIIGGGAKAAIQQSSLPPALKVAATHAVEKASQEIASKTGDVLVVAQTVVSFVPGIGAGVNAAIAAGAALAKGEDISDAVVDAAKNALPGGPVAAQAFDAAYRMVKAAASGQNIGDAALASVRENLPGGELAKRAFDTGLALAHGQNVQQAIKNAAAGIASDQLNNAVSALSSVALPAALTNIAKSLPPEATRVATAIFNQPALQGLPADAIAKALNVAPALATQAVAAVSAAKAGTRAPPAIHEALVTHPTVRPPAIHAAVPTAARVPVPTATAPGTRVGAYGPYPKMTGTVGAPRHGGGGHHGGGHHGGGGFHPARAFRGGPRGPGWWWNVPWTSEIVTTTETCRTWGNPIDMPPSMETAARVALNTSQGRPTSARGPDGVLYLFSIENGVMTARPCAAVAAA